MRKPPSHQETWNELGKWWDENIGDTGDEFHCRLVHPKIIELLADTPKKYVLDAGCGNGALSRKLAAIGFDVLGVDVSLSLLEGAKNRTDDVRFPNLNFDVCDLTSQKDLANLPSNRFDAIVCSMVIHDIPKVNPLLEMVARCLTQNGAFIFSIPHPCFNSPYAKHEAGYIRINNYVEPHHERMRSKIGQPILQDAYHRPISVIFSWLFGQGLFVDGFLEPSYSNTEGDNDEKGYWARYPKISPVLIVRCRKISSTHVIEK